MGTTLGLIALHRRAGMAEFAADYANPRVADFRRRVRMVPDDEVEGAYPARWIGKVTVEARDGRVLEARVDEPKGDPGNTLAPAELEDKLRRLVAFSAAASAAEADELIARVRALPQTARVGTLLPATAKRVPA
jgi:2-methylcitrate dehydratase PrpD